MGNQQSGKVPEAAASALSAIEISQIEKNFERLAISHGTFNKKMYIDEGTFTREFLPQYPMISKLLFEAFDHDRSGFIEFDEFIKGMALLSRGETIDKLRLIFMMFDIDHNGYVSAKELSYILHSAVFNLNTIQETVTEKEEVCFRSLYDYTPNNSDELILTKGQVLKLYKRYDKDWVICQNQKNQVGYVPTNYVTEFKQKVKEKKRVDPEEHISKIVKDAFERFDAEKDGKLDLTEFIRFALESYEVSLLLEKLENIPIAPPKAVQQVPPRPRAPSLRASGLSPELIALCKEAGMSEKELDDPQALRHAMQVLTQASRLKKDPMAQQVTKPHPPPPYSTNTQQLPAKVTQHLPESDTLQKKAHTLRNFRPTSIVRSMPNPRPPNRPAPTLRRNQNVYQQRAATSTPEFHPPPSFQKNFLQELHGALSSESLRPSHDQQRNGPQDQEKQEREKQEKERQERERQERERQERERQERERQEKERQERERQDRERQEREKQDRERQEKEKQDRERQEKEKQEREKQEKERQEREKQEREKQEKEREEKERQEKERQERERKEKNKTKRFKAPRRPLPVPPSATQTTKLPPNWVEYHTEEGHPYYYNTITTKTTWNLPTESPKQNSIPEEKWIKYSTSEGVPYYYNPKTKESVWTLPEDEKEDNKNNNNVPSAVIALQSDIPVAPAAPDLSGISSNATVSAPSDLLSQIQKGVTLHKASESTSFETSKEPEMGGLLAEIRQGLVLKKVDPADITKLSAEDRTDITGILARAIQSRRDYIKTEEKNTNQNDNEWELDSNWD